MSDEPQKKKEIDVHRNVVDMLWVEENLRRAGITTTDFVKRGIASFRSIRVRLFIIHLLLGRTRKAAYKNAHYDCSDKAKIKDGIKALIRQPKILEIVTNHRNSEYGSTNAPSLAWGNKLLMQLIDKAKKDGDAKTAISGLKTLGEFNNWGKARTAEDKEIIPWMERLKQEIISEVKDSKNPNNSVILIPASTPKAEPVEPLQIEEKADGAEKKVELPPLQPPPQESRIVHSRLNLPTTHTGKAPVPRVIRLTDPSRPEGDR